MDLSQEIRKDFNAQLVFMSGQKVPSTSNVRFHRKRTAILGSLIFLADLAEKNGLTTLFDFLIAEINNVRNVLEPSFKEDWAHNNGDIEKVNVIFLCDITEGYNAARENYLKFDVILPVKIPTGGCSTNPELKKVINKLITKLIGE